MKPKAYHHKLFLFLLTGLPAFVVAAGLNYLLVRHEHWAKPLAYAVVLVLQTTINFFLCRALVFETNPAVPWWKSFIVFIQGNFFFRLADWGVYVLLTQYAGLPILAVQVFNVAVFALLKFEFAKYVFERKKSKSAGQQK